MSHRTRLESQLPFNRWINPCNKVYDSVKKWKPAKYQNYMIWILSLETGTPNMSGFTDMMMFCPPIEFIVDLMKYCGDHPQCPITEASINQLCRIFLNSMKIYSNEEGARLVSVEGFQNFIYLIDNMHATIQACGPLYSSIINGKPFIYPIGLLSDKAFVSAVENGHYGLKDSILRISPITGMIEVVSLNATMNVVVQHIYYSVRLNKWRFHEDTTTFYESLTDILQELVTKKQINIALPRNSRPMPTLVDE